MSRNAVFGILITLAAFFVGFAVGPLLGIAAWIALIIIVAVLQPGRAAK